MGFQTWLEAFVVRRRWLHLMLALQAPRAQHLGWPCTLLPPQLQPAFAAGSRTLGILLCMCGAGSAGMGITEGESMMMLLL